VINQWLEIAAIHGAEGGLTDPNGASLIGPEVVAALDTPPRIAEAPNAG
jgi:hypothetical protein